MEKIIGQLKQLFQLYNYVVERECKECIVFALKAVMYPAIEIIPLSDKNHELIEKIRKEYQELNYSVKVQKTYNLEVLEGYLFNGFFHVIQANSRISDKYRQYTSHVIESYGMESDNTMYEYINIPFEKEINFKYTTPCTNIVDSIKKDIQTDSPTLVIVEAAAGFGKTSTSYEILKTYEGIRIDIRPFFMELSKDRAATTFHYLLLSQINRDFDILLKEDLVLYNIKKGKIPLIVDGFDELLSRDIDNGKKDVKFDDVETMLSTIAELLTNQAKVILTTRKTAIFSGEEFVEWYEELQSKGASFNIIRYQLGLPNIKAWLPQQRIDRLPKEILISMNNPVLLGFLKYLSNDEFDILANDTSKLIDCYFHKILYREITRQDIPLNVIEQLVVLRRLACVYGGLDVTSQVRSEVKNLLMTNSSGLLEKYITPNLDLDSLTNKLTNHALLDRKEDNRVGFINEMVFGLLLIQSLINDNDEMSILFQNEFSARNIDKMLLASLFLSEVQKNKLYKNLYEKCNLNNYSKFWSDIKLRNETCHSFKEVSFQDGFISDSFFGTRDSVFENCTFTNILFKSCVLDFAYLNNSTFISCSFDECEFKDDKSSCDFYNCKSNVEYIDTHNYEYTNLKIDTDEKKEILKLYLQVGGQTRRMRMISKVREISSLSSRDFKRVMSSLISEGFIVYNGDKSFITDDGIEYLKQSCNN